MKYENLDATLHQMKIIDSLYPKPQNLLTCSFLLFFIKFLLIFAQIVDLVLVTGKGLRANLIFIRKYLLTYREKRGK